ncbi:hypothetical protein ACP4OV_012883 [Aristida adscensionis]
MEIERRAMSVRRSSSAAVAGGGGSEGELLPESEPAPVYFTARLAALLLCLTALLVFLPLVLPPLPPLPPPPTALLAVVPVWVVGVLLALALLPADGRAASGMPAPAPRRACKTLDA